MEQADESTDRGRRVLVVEDETKLREMLVRAIRDMEFEAAGAPTAEAALDSLSDQHCDIVVSDLNLPGMHGLELCEAVRERWPQTQLIILTAYGDLEAARQAIRLDVVDFLTKPCSLGDVEAALDRALRRSLHGIVAHVSGALDWGPEDQATAGDDRTQTLQDVERAHILGVLAEHDGNRATAAEALGISVRTLYYRLSDYERRGFLVR